MSDGQIENGVYVHTVKPGSPASRAGLLPYDRVLQVNALLICIHFKAYKHSTVPKREPLTFC